jgi:hypothetical protein
MTKLTPKTTKEHIIHIYDKIDNIEKNHLFHIEQKLTWHSKIFLAVFLMVSAQFLHFLLKFVN